MNSFEAGGLIHWFNHKHLMVTYSVVDTGLHFGEEAKMSKTLFIFKELSLVEERELHRNDYKLE